MGSVITRPFAAGDEVAVNEGFNEVFGLERPLGEWRWKFFEPQDRRYIMLAWDENGRLLAHYGAVPVRVQADGEVYRAGQIVDVFSRQEARQGLAAARTYLETFKRFVDRFCGPDELSLCYGFPGERALRLGVKRTMYADIPPWPMDQYSRPVTRRAGLALGWRVTEGFDATALDALWQRARGRYPIAMVRDAQHQAARFRGRPSVEYRHFIVWRRTTPVGAAVLRLAGDVAYLADLIWDGQHGKGLVALDRRLRAVARRHGALRLQGWLQNDAEAARHLSRVGWEHVGDVPNLRCVVNVFHPALEHGRVPGRFYLTMADSDLV